MGRPFPQYCGPVQSAISTPCPPLPASLDRRGVITREQSRRLHDGTVLSAGKAKPLHGGPRAGLTLSASVRNLSELFVTQSAHQVSSSVHCLTDAGLPRVNVLGCGCHGILHTHYKLRGAQCPRCPSCDLIILSRPV